MYVRTQQAPIPISNLTICSLPEDFITGVFQVMTNITVITANIISAAVAMHIEVMDHPLLKSKCHTQQMSAS